MPWISIRDAKANHGGTIEDTIERTNELGIANSSARLLPAGTVCLSRTASIGYVVVTSRPMATSQDFVNWVCGETLEPDFLKYLLISEGEQLLRFASGAIHQTIYFPEAKAFHVCVPSRAEQCRIVGILDEAFEGIATAKAKAEKNLRNARELVGSHIELMFASRGPGWGEQPLERVADIINGYAFKSADFQTNKGAKSIKITNVGVREFVAEAANRLPATFAQRHADVAVDKGSIVLALTRTIVASGLKVAIVPPEFDQALLNQRVAAIQPHANQLATPFLFAFLSTRRFMAYVSARVNTLMQPNLSIADLRRLPVPVPGLSEQATLVAKLSRLETELQALESVYRRKLAALDELKKSLLHQAFTGAL